MTHRDRAGDATGQWAGRRGAASDAGHRQGFSTPAQSPVAGSPARPEAASRMARDAGASPRHALLAENLNLEAWGKPSLWVITKDLWYKAMERLAPFWRRRGALMRSPVRPDVRGIGFNWPS